MVGAHRSGTTLTWLMLDAHPELALTPETQFFSALHEVWMRTGDPERLLQALLDHPRWFTLGLADATLRERLRVQPADDLGEFLRTVFALYSATRGKPRWGDKTPEYVLEMPRIAEALPEAQFIHVIRDGRDVALSIVRLWFGPSSIGEAAHWWADWVRRARRDARAHGLAYTEVRFEDLVTDPEPELVRLCGLLSLRFDAAMLDHRTALAKHAWLLEHMGRLGTPQHQVSALAGRIAQPPDRERIAVWRREMSAGDRRRFERIAGDLLEELGYELSAS